MDHQADIEEFTTNLSEGLADISEWLGTNLPPAIDYIDMPEAIRGQYQYFTEAKMENLRAAGCPAAFRPLEEAVADYVKAHLLAADPYL